MEAVGKQSNHNINNFVNNAINDLKNLTNALRSLNRHSAEVNNAIINKLLLSTDRDSLQITKDILGHLLHIVDLKGMNIYILSILTKVISFIKIIEQEEQRSEQKMFQRALYEQEMGDIMYHIIDIIFLFKSKYKDADMMLRIIQTTFSLIDAHMLQYVGYHLLTRIYAICFECSQTNLIIQNISVSALFALTQIIFSSNKVEDSSTILQQFLEYLLCGKKFSWIKDQDLKGLIWDMVIVGIRNYPTQESQYLIGKKEVVTLLKDMYKVSIKRVFLGEERKSSKITSKGKKGDNEKSSSSKKEGYMDFIRFYKTFVFLSINLSIKSGDYQTEIIPFKDNIQLFKVAYQLERDSKLYLILEGISLLLIEGSHLLIQDERPILLLDVFSRVVQELCLSNIELQITSEARDLFLDKMCGDLNKISDSDYVKLIRNTIIKLRKKFQGTIDKKVRTGELLSERTQISDRSELQMSETNTGSSSRKRWQKLITNVIRIIRYLTSLNMKEIINEQTVRKLIIELQYWYLICPSVRTRNLILQQLSAISNLIDSKLQAIKVSQCVQIGSNIIYGYYDCLDSVGLTIILKMMARVKVSWQEGKGFEELDEVCTMSQKLYIQQNLVHNERSFNKTIQSFVQCVNSILSDLQQPQKQQKFRTTTKNPLQKMLKMTQYIFSKLQIILNQNSEYIHNEWNFLTSFWISLCCNNSQEIKHKTMNHIQSIIIIMLKKTQIQQELILSTYLQLAKLQYLEISKLVLAHLKQILLSIHSEAAIVEIFRIIRIIIDTKEAKDLHNQVYDLEEMIIKQSLFRIKSSQNIMFVIDSLTSLHDDKNQQYKTVNLIWTISDHLKTLAQGQEEKQRQKIWKKIFGKLYWLGLHSIHGQTKQSCIHTCTQILAESSAILGVQAYSIVIKEIYLELFFVLMSLNPKSPSIQGGAQAQMAKVAIKNMVKMVKKCISDELEESNEYLEMILDRFQLNFSPSKDKPMEYLFQICTLLDFYKGVINGDSPKMTVNKKKVSSVIDLMEKEHEKYDKTTVMWRKKYEPAFENLKSFFVVE